MSVIQTARGFSIACLAISLSAVVAAQEKDSTGSGGENASNPLAAINNTDLKYQYYDLGSADRNDFFVLGSYMVQPKLKVIYELHYWETDLSGRSEHEFERLSLKPIYFPKVGELGAWKYKLAVGFEWILDFNHADQGIGSGSDQLAPLAGVAFSRPEWGFTVIPLVQHFLSYSGNDVNTTAVRLITIKSLPSETWAKADLKVPIDWEHDNAIPASLEVQVGKMFNPNFGVFVEGLIGIGGDRAFDRAVGLGLRFNY